MTSESIVNFPVFANLSVSFMDKMDPGLSNGVAGTHEGIPQRILKVPFLHYLSSIPPLLPLKHWQFHADRQYTHCSIRNY